MMLDDLLSSSRLERVPADPARAGRQLQDAIRHLQGAKAIVDVDRAGAYQLAYAAARKAITAHMAGVGLRVRNTPGAHHAVGLYAATLPTAPEFVAFDRMRRNRHRSAYAARAFSPSEVRSGLDSARQMVDAARALLLDLLRDDLAGLDLLEDLLSEGRLRTAAEDAD